MFSTKNLLLYRVDEGILFHLYVFYWIRAVKKFLSIPYAKTWCKVATNSRTTDSTFSSRQTYLYVYLISFTLNIHVKRWTYAQQGSSSIEWKFFLLFHVFLSFHFFVSYQLHMSVLIEVIFEMIVRRRYIWFFFMFWWLFSAVSYHTLLWKTHSWHPYEWVMGCSFSKTIPMKLLYSICGVLANIKKIKQKNFSINENWVHEIHVTI